MTTATSSQTDASAFDHAAKSPDLFSAWTVLIGLCLSLTVLLIVLPDGVADAVQVLIGWLVVGLAAVISVVAIVQGLERLLDCDAS